MTTMNYRQLQASLKELRDVRGYDIGVKLNADYNTLFKAWYNLTYPELGNSTDDTETEMGDNRETTQEATNMVKKKMNGVVLYEGLSAIDNTTPIVVIATGLTNKTANPKTGNMIQTWILIQDEFPTEAINNGNDSAICGNCPHRKYDGKRSCYVNPMSFSSVYKAYRKGNYPQYNPELHSKYFQGRKIRYGSYGEPINIPIAMVEHLNSITSGHTGYTHQWRDNRFSEYRKYFMASVDLLFDFLDAKDSGWSTFRVHSVNDEITDISCQGGIKTTCGKCTLCDGAEDRQKHVGIIAHGSGAKYVKAV